MTYQPKSEFLQVMAARGFLQDCTDMEGLDKALMSGVVPGYIGFDATAPSLHVGSLMQIMMLRWLQQTGHQPIALMGGGTSKIGDPSFRDDARRLMTNEVIDTNIAGIRQVFAKFIEFGTGDGSDGRAIMANNADWLDGLQYIPFLREVGALFSVNRMLSFESVRSRLDRDQSLSFLEFNYMILQAYDFSELNRRHGCLLQMGGSDQWGNIVNGIDLSRRMNRATVFGLTSPLLTKADGSKMGKSAEGAIWLNADMLSPYEFWQFWRNTFDTDVGRFLKLYTELPVDECERLGALEGSEINEAKIRLANEVTTMCHGADAATAAEATAREVFEKGGIGTDLPSITISNEDFVELEDRGISLPHLIVKAGLAKTGKEAKRLIQSGAVHVNDERVTDTDSSFDYEEITRALKIAVGKKRLAVANTAHQPEQLIGESIATESAGQNDRFEVYKDKRGEFRWRRIGSSGRIVGASAEGYANISDAKSNMTRGNVGTDKWEFYKDRRGEFRWRRISINGNVIGASSEGYATQAAAENSAKRQGYTPKH